MLGPFEKEVTVISVDRKTSKKGNPFNLVTIGGLGFSFSTFLPEELVPDFIEGSNINLKFVLTFDRGHPDISIKGVVR